MSRIVKTVISSDFYDRHMNKTRAPLIGANGNHVTNGIPHGSTSLTPFLAITNAGAAVEFYRLVFDARIVDVMDINGLVIHAELDFGNGKLHIGEPNRSEEQ